MKEISWKRKLPLVSFAVDTKLLRGSLSRISLCSDFGTSDDTGDILCVLSHLGHCDTPIGSCIKLLKQAKLRETVHGEGDQPLVPSLTDVCP